MKNGATGNSVKLSATEELILGLLITKKSELYGQQIVDLSGGEIKRGTVYVTLDRMQDKGLVDSREEERDPTRSGIVRRLYTPTGAGVRAYHAWVARRAGVLGLPIPALG